VLFTGGGYGQSNVTISNNYFAYNYNNALQISNCQNCNVTGNYALDSGWDLEDAGAMPAGYDTGTWSNNTFACDSTGTGLINSQPGWQGISAPGCAWQVGIGCSTIGCTPGEYSGVTVTNNTITGHTAAIITWSLTGANILNNSFTNGGWLRP
jgi:hypothetical protein